jgi:hypothetical protein
VFKVVGTDIEFRVIGPYEIPAFSFRLDTITFYNDIDGMVTRCRNGAFQGAFSNPPSSYPLEWVNFPKCIIFDALLFSYAYNLNSITAPELLTMNGGYIVNRTKLLTLDFPKLTSCGNLSFATEQSAAALSILTNINIPKIKTMGSDSNFISNNEVFRFLKLACTIKVNIHLATNNFGAPDGDLLFAKNSRASIIEFYDDNGIYVSTL